MNSLYLLQLAVAWGITAEVIYNEKAIKTSGFKMHKLRTYTTVLLNHKNVLRITVTKLVRFTERLNNRDLTLNNTDERNNNGFLLKHDFWNTF